MSIPIRAVFRLGFIGLVIALLRFCLELSGSVAGVSGVGNFALLMLLVKG